MADGVVFSAGSNPTWSDGLMETLVSGGFLDARVHWATTLFLVDLGVGPTFLGHKTRVLVGWECCGLEISEFIPLFSVTVPKSQP